MRDVRVAADQIGIVAADPVGCSRFDMVAAVAADVLMQISRVWLRMSSCRFRGCGCGCARAVFAMSSREELWLRMSSCSFRGVFYKIMAADVPLQFWRCLLANWEVLLGIVVGDVPMQFSRCLVVYQFMAADDCACEM